ncbi:MAG: NnrS family protein [Rhodospirillales bacterium]|nr:NnrS family protein [Rhodospirillales bacterium]
MPGIHKRDDIGKGPPAFLGYGFRPFFFLAGFAGIFGVVLWLASISGAITLPSAFAPSLWHAHEMLFGFVTAAIAGFLLTAIPSWTGRPPVRGAMLGGLVLLWIAGRLAVATSAIIGTGTAAVIDLAFLAALLLVVVRELVAAKNRRNLPMAAALFVLLIANGLMHADVLSLDVVTGSGWRLGFIVATLLVVLIGGRIIPNFTANWLTRQGGSGSAPAPFGWIDKATLVATALALTAWITIPGTIAAVLLGAIAAFANAIRLTRWCGWRTRRDPLLFVLHVGYAWVPVALVLLALSQANDLVPESAAVHALGAGVFGTMIAAVMTRATLGHTGRPLRAGSSTVALYVLITIAAVARVGATLWLNAADGLLDVSGAAWTGAFVLFIGVYGSALLRPRSDGKPG